MNDEALAERDDTFPSEYSEWMYLRGIQLCGAYCIDMYMYICAYRVSPAYDISSQGVFMENSLRHAG